MAAHAKRPRRWLAAIVTLAAAVLLPLVEWLDDRVDHLHESLFFQLFAKWCFVVAALVLIVLFSGCTPADVTPPATTGPVPTTPANREPEEDEPGWNSCVHGNLRPCDETSY